MNLSLRFTLQIKQTTGVKKMIDQDAPKYVSMAEVSDREARAMMAKYGAQQDQRNHLPNVWDLAARCNKHKVVITIRDNGRKVKTISGYRKRSEYKL